MMARFGRAVFLVLAMALMSTFTFAAFFQSEQSQQNKDKSKDKDKDKGKPADNKGQQQGQQKKDDQLFGGSIGVKSSRKSSDSATMGFNGIGPDGSVETAMLNASPNGADEAAAQGVSFYGVDHSQLTTFIKEGNLKEKGK